MTFNIYGSQLALDLTEAIYMRSNSIYHRLAFWCLTIFVSLSAHNTMAGGDGSGGGSFQCSEYSDLALMITSSLTQIGQDKIDSIMKKINAEDLENIQKNLTCLPVNKLNRSAYSFRKDNDNFMTHLRIDTSSDSWAQLKLYGRVRLVTHELAVLAGYEKDGQYLMSKFIMEILEKNTQYFKDAKRFSRAKRFIRNSDGTASIILPTDEDGYLYGASCYDQERVRYLGCNKDAFRREFANSVCKNFEFESGIDITTVKSIGGQTGMFQVICSFWIEEFAQAA